MPELEIAIDPELPSDLALDLRRHLEERWPDVAVTPLRLPAPQRDARDGPLLVLLRPDATPPPADPGTLAVVPWDRAADAQGRGPLFRQVDVEIARVTAQRRGRPPERDVSPPPREMTRRALLRIPLPIGRPLPPVPWFEAGLCLQAEGCDKCAACCPQGAFSLSAGEAVIDAAACTGCGVCVATCPTGAVESAHLGDGQWRAALGVLKADPGERRLALRCPQSSPGVPDDRLTLQVGCIGEVGWYHVLTCHAETGHLPELSCERRDCHLRPQAEAALARLELAAASLPAGLAEMPTVKAADTPRAPRRGDIATALRRLGMAIGEEARPEIWPQLGWTPQVGGNCTLCGGCVQTCPAGVFAIEEEALATSLRVDAALCTGCGACARTCPEQALEVVPARISELLGSLERFHAAKQLCKGCGQPYESPTFVAALRQRMVKAGFGGPLVERLDYCPECRAALPRG